jgi:ubiquinol oxidase
LIQVRALRTPSRDPAREDNDGRRQDRIMNDTLITPYVRTPDEVKLDAHHPVCDWSDRLAQGITRSLRFLADTFFAKRYGNRAIVLETVAAVPGLVGAAMIHLRCLRWMRHDHGWIRALMEEAENERMHLMTFIEIARPSRLERALVLVAQAGFFTFFLLLYLLSARTAHRLVGYFEEQAVISYSQYLQEIDAGRVENVPAPKIAIDYWRLPANARLREVVLAVRADEAGHRDANHGFADELRPEGAIAAKSAA